MFLFQKISLFIHSFIFFFFWIVTIFRAMADEGEADDQEREEEDDFLKSVFNTMFADVTLRGIPQITKVSLTQAKEIELTPTGEYKSVSTWQLVTDGTSLQDVLAMDNIDNRRTITNSITEVFDVLGIEAGRLSLLNELRTVLGFYGLYVNYRHLAILCDVMTTSGALMAITRHGMMSKSSGPLMKCSFEQTVEILLEVSKHSIAWL
jgi:DNA-directed RNA polymerase II subunit RPB1